MYKNTLKDIERVENKLFEIRALLNSEDGYTVCDTIISNINDDLLSQEIKDMLDSMGYNKKIIIKVLAIVSEIQK